jgi:hypothetical protein
MACAPVWASLPRPPRFGPLRPGSSFGFRTPPPQRQIVAQPCRIHSDAVLRSDQRQDRQPAIRRLERGRPSSAASSPKNPVVQDGFTSRNQRIVTFRGARTHSLALDRLDAPASEAVDEFLLQGSGKWAKRASVSEWRIRRLLPALRRNSTRSTSVWTGAEVAFRRRREAFCFGIC